MTTAIFAGSFDPFTIGHLDIARRAAAMFDRLVVAVGVNVAKEPDPQQLDSRLRQIRRAIDGIPNAEVTLWRGLTVDLARQIQADGSRAILVRGVRTAADVDYETRMADINMRLAGIDTVMLPARPELASISSSVVRELRAFGADTTPFLP